MVGFYKKASVKVLRLNMVYGEVLWWASIKRIL